MFRNAMNISKGSLNPIMISFANEYSVYFDGVDECAYCSDDITLDVSNNLTLSAWVRTTQNTTDFAVSKWSATPNLSYFMGMATGGYLYCGISSDGGTTNAKLYRTTSARINDGNWHHIACTFVSGTLKLYIDGTHITSITSLIDGTCNSINNSSAIFAIGSSSTPDLFWEGYIDEVSIWDTTFLSDSDISTIYNSGKPNDLSDLSLSGNLVSWWRMGDGDMYPTLTDKAGSNHITMYNMEIGDRVKDIP